MDNTSFNLPNAKEKYSKTDSIATLLKFENMKHKKLTIFYVPQSLLPFS